MWYGIGNTALPHPSTIRLGLTQAGRLILYSGAVDIGQGANTILGPDRGRRARRRRSSASIW